MRRILSVLCLSALVGCTTTPPKVHTPVTSQYEIELTETSSEPLKLLASMQAVGVRDLTPKEFKRTLRDREKFEKNVGGQEGFNRAAYEAGGVGLGLAAGLSVGSVLGFAALTSFAADDTPDNYVFAWDFDGKARVYSKQGKVDNEVLIKAFETGLADFVASYPDLFQLVTEPTVISNLDGSLPKVDSRGRVFKTYVYNEKRKRRSVEADTIYYRIGNSARRPKSRTIYSGINSYCSGDTNGCEIKAIVNDINKPMPIVTNLYRLIAANLPDDYVIYLPPDQGVYRIPMVAYGGSGAIEFLVDKTAEQ